MPNSLASLLALGVIICFVLPSGLSVHRELEDCFIFLGFSSITSEFSVEIWQINSVSPSNKI